ncbi:MAG: hypothetical protein QM786_05210 [Breznakibacter sp.]
MEKPNVYIFNPTCDMAVLNRSVSYMPPARLRAFEHDLATIMLWLASPSDMVVVPSLPDGSFLQALKNSGAELPIFITWEQLRKYGHTFGEIRPWGWSPEMHHRTKALKAKCNPVFQSLPVATWQPGHLNFFSRQTNQSLVEEIAAVTAAHPRIAVKDLPLAVRSVDQARKALECFGHKAVFKTPWSSSGRGVMMVDRLSGRMADERWLAGAIRQQSFLMAEPLYQKVFDMSFHFWLHPNGQFDYLGHNFFTTDHGGKFQGCFLNEMPLGIKTNAGHILADTIKEAKGLLLSALPKLRMENLYSGPVGVDALWYLDESGALKLQPAIEANLRYTMGLVNLMMRKKLNSAAEATWQIGQFEENGWEKTYREKFNGGPAMGKSMPLVPQNARLFGAWIDFNANGPPQL